ncbi:hypothetical protein KFK09_008026 [Dendrobium nobile]|uniref:Protein kinase domain-containing protein n=1 Tax=Dendrobium nobile TaxID=94219 RepID=A0A8T3BVR2_DENNO|nr:hypothetical protein KFK09_008026 [Dendrobium nobile]
MIRELERFGNLIHPNLMIPIGYVIYKDVALLLHPHIVNGTLAQLLYESPKDEYEPDWPRRLSIAISLAEGLALLHHVTWISHLARELLTSYLAIILFRGLSFLVDLLNLVWLKKQ